MDEVFLKIPSDIFFLLLNLEIVPISVRQRRNEEKKINAEDWSMFFKTDLIR